MKYLFAIIMFFMAQTTFGQIVVSDQVPMPIKYPAEVYKMTDAEFFNWATELNKKQVADVEARRKSISEGRYNYGTQFREEGSLNVYRSNNSRTYIRQETVYPMQWSNPNYVGPGPLTIVNPYCRPTR